MNRFSPDVSDEEFNNASCPTREQVAIVAQALGMMLAIGVPIPKTIETVMSVTPHARLRRVLNEMHCSWPNQHTITFIATSHIAMLDANFVSAIARGESSGKLGQALMEYAADSCIPLHAVGNQIGRSEEVQYFTATLAYRLMQNCPILWSIREQVPHCSKGFRNVLQAMCQKIEDGALLVEALMTQPETFDPLYIAMIDEGEGTDQLERALLFLMLG